MGWWSGKLRQTVRHLFGRVTEAERAELRDLLTTSQLLLFASMHPADQRHGLDVAATLRQAGHRDTDLLLAALFHDAGKGPDVRLPHRVAWSLGERYGEGMRRLARRIPGFGRAFEGIETHVERSAVLALGAGCSERTAELIRGRAAAVGTADRDALRRADEAN